MASMDIPSCIRLQPGLEVEVMHLTPVAAAPKTMLMEAISLWDCTNTLPRCGNSRANHSVISF